MAVHRLQRVQVIPGPLATVAPFFEAPENLARITPPWMRFRVVTPGPILMAPGARIDYTLRLLGLPLSWRTVITRFEPGRCFVDEQERGPYRLWRHLHEFEPVEGGTLVRDTVHYVVPLGLVGEAARRLYVSQTLEHIFDHRAATIAALFSSGS
jgi:ligand-binding SRPBCC domain-containing protein